MSHDTSHILYDWQDDTNHYLKAAINFMMKLQELQSTSGIVRYRQVSIDIFKRTNRYDSFGRS